MQRSALKWLAITVLGLSINACDDVGVGDPCIPEQIPCTEGKGCGFDASESYIESSSVQCKSRFCIVHHLENSTAPQGLANPGKLCSDKNEPGCLKDEDLEQSVYCTCRCNGPKTSVEFCECPGGFKCEEILALGGDGIKGSYCVRPDDAAK